MTITLAWWWVPVALVVLGVIVGTWRMSRYPHDDWFDYRSLVFLFWFFVFCAAAIGVVGGRVLAGLG